MDSSDSSMYYTTTAQPDTGIGLGGLVLYLAVIVLMIASLWKVFVKAGKPGWAAIIPIYNTVVMLEIVGRPIWWVLLFFIPFVNVVFAVILLKDLSKAFGKGIGTTLLLLFLPFIGFPILGFGSASYRGPVVTEGSAPTQAS